MSHFSLEKTSLIMYAKTVGVSEVILLQWWPDFAEGTSLPFQEISFIHTKYRRL